MFLQISFFGRFPNITMNKMSLYDYPLHEGSSDDPYDVEFCAFAGAGVNGLAYVGVLQSLEERDIRRKIKYWIGTSAGSIIATFSALGASVDFILKCLEGVDFNLFIDYGGSIPSKSWWGKLRNYYSATELFSKLGLARGTHFNSWIRACINKLGYPPNLTFTQLYHQTGNHLVSVGACLNGFDALYMSRSSFPHMSIADAMHISMIIPYIFQPVVIQDHLNDPITRMVLDGGLLDNYPLNATDVQSPDGRLLGINRKAIGFFCMSNGLWGPHNETIDNFFKFSQMIVSMMFRQRQRIQSQQPYFWDRSVALEVFGHSPVDFAISSEQIDRLIKSGYEGAEAFLKARRKTIQEKGNLPDNLFIPLIHQQIPRNSYLKDWVSHGAYWFQPLQNENLKDTLIYQTNPEERKVNLVEL